MSIKKGHKMLKIDHLKSGLPQIRFKSLELKHDIELKGVHQLIEYAYFIKHLSHIIMHNDA